MEVNCQPFEHFHGMDICWKSTSNLFGHFHGMDICWKSTSNLLDTSMVWTFVGSQLPTFWTLPWYGNLLEVNFQPFVDTSMVWKFVGSQLSTFWTLPWYGNLLEVNFQPSNFHTTKVAKRLEVSWKFVGSRNDFHYLEKTRFFQCS